MESKQQHGNDGRRGSGVPPLPPVLRDCADLAPGTHLVTRRRGYLHHGIYVGSGRVVHYGGLARSWRRGPVEEVSLERFAAGRPVQARPTAAARFDSEEIVARARSRLGEDRYRITSNNCEHFCAWCIHGESRSEQIERLLRLPLRLLRRFGPLARRMPPPEERPAGHLAA
jgi:hypothetical protein